MRDMIRDLLAEMLPVLLPILMATIAEYLRRLLGAQKDSDAGKAINAAVERAGARVYEIMAAQGVPLSDQAAINRIAAQAATNFGGSGFTAPNPGGYVSVDAWTPSDDGINHIFGQNSPGRRALRALLAA